MVRQEETILAGATEKARYMEHDVSGASQLRRSSSITHKKGGLGA
jgi:hypothetical protein